MAKLQHKPLNVASLISMFWVLSKNLAWYSTLNLQKQILTLKSEIISMFLIQLFPQIDLSSK